MQQIVRRRPVQRLLAEGAGPLPSYLLFGPALGYEGRAPLAEPEPARRSGRRRTSVLVFLERVLWPN